MIRVEGGDCLEIVPAMVDMGITVDSIVTDPPYHLTATVKRFGASNAKAANKVDYGRIGKGFMGLEWDGGDVAFRPETWAAMLEILRPGGMLLSFGGTRTYHRMACAIEDAGFVIMDQIAWVYGTGWPKRKDMLKPAMEPICVAYRPGGPRTLQVDECRVATGSGALLSHMRNGECRNNRDGEASADRRYADRGATSFAGLPGPRGGDPAGRWPANLIHDGSAEVLAAFPQTEPSSARARHTSARPASPAKGSESARVTVGHDDDGGSAARFFYSAKASKAEREGSQHPTVKPISLMRYLVRLVTPLGGTVLDPFAGTGTTGVAAEMGGRNSILVERDPGYLIDLHMRAEEANA